LVAIREKAHQGAVNALTCTPDARLLASGGNDGRVVLWDARTLQRLLTFPAHNSPVSRLAFEAGGPCLAVCGMDDVVTLWDLDQVRSGLVGLGLDCAELRDRAPHP
jgi:WD40 repeat protein